MSASAKKVATLTSLLFGLSIDPSEIELATDTSAGKALIDWLASQLGEDLDVDPKIGAESIRKAAVTRIGLEHNELLGNLPGGLLPSQAEKRVEASNAEFDLLESELDTLKKRLAQTRVATQKTKGQIRERKEALRSEVEINKQKRARLSELSLQADETAATVIGSAQRLLAQCSTNTLDHEVSSAKAISAQRGQLVSRYISQKRLLSDNHNIPNIADVEKEISRLSAARYTHDPVLQLCFRLEAKFEDGERLSEEDISQIASQIGAETDVASVLESAWSKDQTNMLLAKEKISEEACQGFAGLITPLEALEQHLCTRYNETKEAEALCGALLLELEDMSNASAVPDDTEPEPRHHDLDYQIRVLLKSLKDLRIHSDRPLVLLEPEDTLRVLENFASESCSSSEELVRIPKASAVLDTIYNNSPANTSRPFMPPREIIILENKAKKEAIALGDSVAKLERLLSSKQ